jgi:hypothetical protein
MLISYIMQKCLLVLSYCVNHRQSLGEPINDVDFTPQAFDAFSKSMSYEQKEDE